MGFYSHEEELPVESDFPRSTHYLSCRGDVVLISMLELTERFLEKVIAVMEFSAKKSMYQLRSPDDILQKLQLSYFTEAFVGNIQYTQHTAEVWAL